MRKLILSGAVALLSAMPALADETQPHTIAVMGEAEMQLPPDFATVELGVITQGKTVSPALAENSSKMTHVVEAVRAQGIADKNIQTSDFVIQPKYQKRVPGEDYDPDALRPIIGYAIANHVTVTVNDMTKIAKIIDASVAAGANASGNVDFRLHNLTEHMDKARETAVENAQHKAQVLTAAAHLTLGEALSVTDNEANTSYNRRGEYMMAEQIVVVGGGRASTPILPGEITLRVQVTVVYAVK